MDGPRQHLFSAQHLMIEGFLYAARARGLSAKTLRCYRQRIGYLYQYAGLIHENILKLKREQLQKYFVGRIGKVSPATINGEIRVWNLFYNFLIKEDILQSNPMRGIALVREPKRIKAVIQPEQLKLLLSKFDKKHFCGYRDYVVSLLMYDACLRLDEILSLRLSDIRMTPSRIIKVIGKGDKERYVSFSPRTAIKLSIYMGHFRKDIPGDLLFPTSSGKKLDGTNVYRSLARCARKAGIAIKFGPHWLRHSGATLLYKLTKDIRLVQHVLGHESVSTTQIYLHIDTDDIVKVYENYGPLGAVNI